VLDLWFETVVNGFVANQYGSIRTDLEQLGTAGTPIGANDGSLST
jgi:hypothetical protein